MSGEQAHTYDGKEVMPMKLHIPFLASLFLLAGLWTGCANSDNSPLAETIPSISDKLIPEESALVDLGETESESDTNPASQETL